jgi:hypothetical protein
MATKRGGVAAKKRLAAVAGMVEAKDTDQGLLHQAGSPETSESDDGFGMNDDDWDVYRDINRVEDMGFEEEDEEDREKIDQIERQIADIDPEFTWKMLQAGSKIQTEADFQVPLFVDQFRPTEILFEP